jgi:hypothetical protein
MCRHVFGGLCKLQVQGNIAFTKCKFLSTPDAGTISYVRKYLNYDYFPLWWDCDRSITGTWFQILRGSIDVCLLWVLCVFR